MGQKIRNELNFGKYYTEYVPSQLVWDLESRVLKINVKYYNNKQHIFSKDYYFEPQEEVDVWELIDKLKTLHTRENAII